MSKLIEQLAVKSLVEHGGELIFSKEKFAELIVGECIYTIQRKIVRNGNTPENIRSRQHIIDLGNKFGITFPMDYVGVEE